MTTCQDNHPETPIQHSEFHCPLCAEIEDRNTNEETYHLGMDAAEDYIVGMQAVAEETAQADTLQLIAQVEQAEGRENKGLRVLQSAERTLYQLRNRTYTKVEIARALLDLEREIHLFMTEGGVTR